MKKSIILYHSKTGITKRFAEEISRYIAGKGYETQTVAVNDFQAGMTEPADYVLLGCWTAGLMLLLQHPDKTWIEFAHQLPPLSGKKIALFTTYKLATGSMFKKMRKHLSNDGANPAVELKSRKGNLSEENKKVLDAFLN